MKIPQPLSTVTAKWLPDAPPPMPETADIKWRLIVWLKVQNLKKCYFTKTHLILSLLVSFWVVALPQTSPKDL